MQAHKITANQTTKPDATARIHSALFMARHCIAIALFTSAAFAQVNNGGGGIVGGQTSLLAAPTVAQTAPSPSLASECPSGVNPFEWIQDASGSYHTMTGVDPTAYTNMGNGHLVFCRPFFINGSAIVPMPFKNALLGIFQMNGNGEDFLTNDNRGIAGGNLVNSSYVAGANSTLEGIYFEADVQGTPVLGNDLITPLNQSVEAIAGVVGDTHSGQVNGPMVGVRGAAYVMPQTTNAYTNCGLCTIGTVGEAGLSTNGKNQTFTSAGVYGFCGFVANDGNRAHFGGCYGMYAAVGAPGANNYTIYAADNAGQMSTNADYGLFVQSTHGPNTMKSRFQSATIFDVDIRTALPGAAAPGNTDTAGKLAFAASTTTSYTFLNTSNTAAPVCVVSNEFTAATATTSISTLNATTLTVTASSSITGTVNYICVARN